jgi:hypothetical protein
MHVSVVPLLHLVVVVPLAEVVTRFVPWQYEADSSALHPLTNRQAMHMTRKNSTICLGVIDLVHANKVFSGYVDWLA